MRPRQDPDNDFILELTRREMAPILEQAWNFSWDEGHARKFLLDLLHIGSTEMIILEGTDQPAGYVWYALRDPTGWFYRSRVFWLNYVVLDRPYQRKGLGSHVMDYCEEKAERGNCTEIGLWVQKGNDRARSFYEKRRFRPVRSEKNNVLMRKALPLASIFRRW